MHYWWNAFALDPRRPTITAKNGARIEPSNDFTEVNFLRIIIISFQKNLTNNFNISNRLIFWISIDCTIATLEIPALIPITSGMMVIMVNCCGLMIVTSMATIFDMSRAVENTVAVIA